MKLPFAPVPLAAETAGSLMSGKAFGLAKDHLLRPSARLETIMEFNASAVHREPWNKGRIVGQKAPFKLRDIWALRIRLQMEGRVRELALFNLGIDSKLRGCDLVALKVRDVCHGDQVAARAITRRSARSSSRSRRRRETPSKHGSSWQG